MKKLVLVLALSLLVGCSPVASGTKLLNSDSTQTQLTAMVQTTAKTLTSKDVVGALKEAGIKVEEVVNYTEETDSNKLLGRPNQYTAKSNFKLTGDEVSKGQDPDNTIEVFEKVEDAKARKEYIESVIKGIAFAQQYIYQKGVYVLRIDNQTTPTNAKKIEEAFYNIVK